MLKELLTEENPRFKPYNYCQETKNDEYEYAGQKFVNRCQLPLLLLLKIVLLTQYRTYECDRSLAQHNDLSAFSFSMLFLYSDISERTFGSMKCGLANMKLVNDPNYT